MCAGWEVKRLQGKLNWSAAGQKEREVYSLTPNKRGYRADTQCACSKYSSARDETRQLQADFCVDNYSDAHSIYLLSTLDESAS
jgi:hypothetical protein